MADVVVCTPWIDTDCIWRERAKIWTRAFWWNLGVPVVYGTSEARPLNRSQARNDAARKAQAEVLFFADADMWVPAWCFEAAISEATVTGRMVLAYTDHMRLNRWSTETVYDRQESLQGQTVQGCSSGAFAITRKLWDEVGGNDERFEGWGYEDRAFQLACYTLAGEGKRIEGTSYHLWHPSSPDLRSTTPERLAGLELAKRYKLAAGVVARAGIIPATKGAQADPEAMRSILAEPGGPLHAVAFSGNH